MMPSKRNAVRSQGVLRVPEQPTTFSSKEQFVASSGEDETAMFGVGRDDGSVEYAHKRYQHHLEQHAHHYDQHMKHTKKTGNEMKVPGGGPDHPEAAKHERAYHEHYKKSEHWYGEAQHRARQHWHKVLTKHGFEHKGHGIVGHGGPGAEPIVPVHGDHYKHKDGHHAGVAGGQVSVVKKTAKGHRHFTTVTHREHHKLEDELKKLD